MKKLLEWVNSFFKVDVSVYEAIGMTGRKKRDMYNESMSAKITLEKYGIKAISPVLEEGIVPDDQDLIPLTPQELETQWYRDKELIRQSNVVLDLAGSLKSEGVTHEIGYARFFLFRPVVRVYPKLGISIARIEDDGIYETVEEAAQDIVARWGTKWKRGLWRFPKLVRGLPKFLWYQLKEFAN